MNFQNKFKFDLCLDSSYDQNQALAHTQQF